MRIYISGPVTGKSDARVRFAEAERKLREQYPLGLIINPEAVSRPIAEQKGLAEAFCHEDYMEICFDLLERCDAICMLEGWQDSRGACQEYGYARAAGHKLLIGVEAKEGFLVAEVNDEMC